MAREESPLRERRRAQTRLEIAQAGLKLFLEKGFEETTADEIAARAGVSRATFFNYFPQKELILAELAKARMTRVEKLLEENPRLPLNDLVALFVEFGAENERMVSGNRDFFPHLFARAGVQAAVQPLFERIVQILAAALRAGGEMRPEVDTRVFSETFFTLYKATMIEWAIRPDLPRGWQAKTMRERLGLLAGLAAKRRAK